MTSIQFCSNDCEHTVAPHNLSKLQKFLTYVLQMTLQIDLKKI